PRDLATLRSTSPPPPFPYTTLFRSPEGRPGHDVVVRDRGRRLRRGRAVLFGTGRDGPGVGLGLHLYLCRDGRTAGLDGRLGADPDRKSTRLNSSHVKSSYAVFCLKK